jgi:hypothetical protein
LRNTNPKESDNTQEVLRIWKAFYDEIVENLDLVGHDIPITVQFETQNTTDTETIDCIAFHNGTLKISGYNKIENEIMRALIAKEVFLSFFPENLRYMKGSLDLAYHFGLQQISEKTFRNMWLSTWKSVNPNQEMPEGYIYNPVDRLEELYKLNGPTGFNSLVRQIIRMVNYGIELEFKEFALYLERFVADYTVPLSSLQARIVELILRNPTMQRKEIARRLKTSTTWMSQVVSDLQNRGILASFEKVALSSIKVRLFNLLFFSSHLKDFREAIDWYPFLYSIAPVISGDRGLAATVCIPENELNMDSLETLVNYYEEMGARVQQFETSKSGSCTFFSDYITDTGEWNIDWAAIALETKKLEGDQELLNVYPNALFQTSDFSKHIDDLGARILSAFERGYTTSAAIRSVVHARQASVSKRLTNFRDIGIIKQIQEVHHVGLNEEAIVYSKNPDVSRIVIALSNHLPRCYLNFSDEDHLFMRALLPKGGTSGLSKALSLLEVPPEIRLIDRRTYGRWGLSKLIHLWNVKSKMWRPYIEELDNWFSKLK